MAAPAPPPRCPPPGPAASSAVGPSAVDPGAVEPSAVEPSGVDPSGGDGLAASACNSRIALGQFHQRRIRHRRMPRSPRPLPLDLPSRRPLRRRPLIPRPPATRRKSPGQADPASQVPTCPGRPHPIPAHLSLTSQNLQLQSPPRSSRVQSGAGLAAQLSRAASLNPVGGHVSSGRRPPLAAPPDAARLQAGRRAPSPSAAAARDVVSRWSVVSPVAEPAVRGSRRAEFAVTATRFAGVRARADQGRAGPRSAGLAYTTTACGASSRVQGSSTLRFRECLCPSPPLPPAQPGSPTGLGHCWPHRVHLDRHGILGRASENHATLARASPPRRPPDRAQAPARSPFPVAVPPRRPAGPPPAAPRHAASVGVESQNAVSQSSESRSSESRSAAVRPS